MQRDINQRHHETADFLCGIAQLAALIFYERLRDGKEPSFQVTVTGKLYFLLPAGPDQQTRTAPILRILALSPIHASHG